MRIPKLCRHKATGQAYVRLGGRQVYLGVYGSPEAESAYRRHLADFLANGGHVPVAADDLTVVELCARYWEYMQTRRYSVGHLAYTKYSLDALDAMFGDTLAADFGPNRLRVLRLTWADRGLSGKTCQTYTAVIKQMFQWAAAREMVPASVHAALKTLEPLQQGRDVPRREPIGPVSQEHIEATRAHLSAVLRDMIAVQLLTGCRPGELVGLKCGDIDTSGQVWTATLRAHKTAHKGLSRTLYFGPKAQTILRPRLLRPASAYLFQPLEGIQERADAALTHRHANQTPTPRQTDRRLGQCYTVGSYRLAIREACLKAGIPVWHPNQLRHSAATQLRRDFGIETARIILGHSDVSMTATYAEADQALAIEAALKRG